jgi:hypothetical protein
MDRLVPQCKQLKDSYDDCMKKWYSEKVSINFRMDQQHPCDAAFIDYSTCVRLGMQVKYGTKNEKETKS